MFVTARFQVPSPLVGEGQGEGAATYGTLSCILSPQGRGEKEDVPRPRS